MYQPTQKQLDKWAQFTAPAMPSDEEFKAKWAKAHHGKQAGWGMGKRDWVTSHMTQTKEYQTGIWQGRVDAARGVNYSEDRNENTYNLGYHRGYTEYQSNRKGWDQATKDEFDRKYVSQPDTGEDPMQEFGIGRVPADVDPVLENMANADIMEHSRPAQDLAVCPKCKKSYPRRQGMTSSVGTVCFDCYTDMEDG